MRFALFTSVFGIIGVLARAGVDRWLYGVGGDFPVSTFAINILGSFALGWVFVAGSEKGLLAHDFSLALSVGLLGGFTTFSAYALQSALLLERGRVLVAASYLFASPVLATAAAALGIFAARWTLS